MKRRILRACYQGLPWTIGLVVLVLIGAAIRPASTPHSSWLTLQDDMDVASIDRFRLHAAAAADAQTENAEIHRDLSAGPDGLFPVRIRKPSGPPLIEVQNEDPLGRTAKVACGTCHSVREANYDNRVPSDLDEFHQSVPLAHGQLTCYACHHDKDMNSLKLADSTAVPFTDVMTLCGQCHGPQLRDYQHGAHGGMNGYWDLTRGPRTRNNCVDCHDPHVPRFPHMKPTFKPRDRFLDLHGGSESHSNPSREVNGE